MSASPAVRLCRAARRGESALCRAGIRRAGAESRDVGCGQARGDKFPVMVAGRITDFDLAERAVAER